jgi:uncharacterized protein (TIGR00255 family)
MLKSMTAFAREQQENDFGEIVWEIKSVNHRYLEPVFRLPDEFRQLEPELRARLGRRVSRGKLDIGLRYKLSPRLQGEIRLNTDLVRVLRDLERDILNIVHDGQSLSVADILRWPGAIDEDARDFTPLRTLALEAFDAALEQLIDNRQREGQALQEMIASRLQRVAGIVREVQQRRPQVLSAMREKWTAQLEDKLQQWSASADSGRLEQELVMLAQKIDVEEELDRLLAHVDEVRQVLERDEPVGRRLDFLMQELNREANTLSSKSQDAETTRLAVDLKVLIEQMREQVQNIE